MSEHLEIEKASESELKDYADYVEDKISAEEMPFTFAQWKQANLDCADQRPKTGD